MQLETTTILDLLLDAGAPIEGVEKAPDADPETLRKLAEEGVEGRPEASPIVSLQQAIAAGRAAAVRRLLERGTSVTRLMPRRSTRHGITPLQYAIEANAADLIGLLLDQGASINAPSRGSALDPVNVGLFLPLQDRNHPTSAAARRADRHRR